MSRRRGDDLLANGLPGVDSVTAVDGWNDLRYLLAVHRHGSLARAAKELKVTKATASRRLDALEKSLGTPLVERKPAGLIALGAIVAKLRKAGYGVGTESYKKVPAGVAADHPRAGLLRHGGLHAGWEGKHPAELCSGAAVELVARRFAAVAPIHFWLRGI